MQAWHYQEVNTNVATIASRDTTAAGRVDANDAGQIDAKAVNKLNIFNVANKLVKSDAAVNTIPAFWVNANAVPNW